MYRIIGFIVLLFLFVDTQSQNDTKTLYVRTSGHLGFMRLSNGDLDRISYWLDGTQSGLQFLADVKIPVQENVFLTIGAGTDTYVSSFRTMYVDQDTNFLYRQKYEISATSFYGGATYRLYSKGDVVGLSGSLILHGVLPRSQHLALTPDPFTGNDTELTAGISKNFALYLAGSLTLEIFPTEFLFFTLGLTYNSGFSPLFDSHNGFRTTTSGTLLNAGIGVCF